MSSIITNINGERLTLNETRNQAENIVNNASLNGFILVTLTGPAEQEYAPVSVNIDHIWTITDA